MPDYNRHERGVVYMTTGERIKQRRVELGWSLRELAKKMGYANQSTVSRIESGSIDIPQSRIVKFAEVLGVSVAYLMGWEENDTEQRDMTIGDLFEYLRKQRKLSVAEFAEEIGLTEAEIRKYEKGKGGIPSNIVKMLADYFDISVGKLSAGKVKGNDIFAAFASTNEAYVEQVTKWVKVFGNERFSDEEFEKIIDYAKFILSQRANKK